MTCCLLTLRWSRTPRSAVDFRHPSVLRILFATSSAGVRTASCSTPSAPPSSSRTTRCRHPRRRPSPACSRHSACLSAGGDHPGGRHPDGRRGADGLPSWVQPGGIPQPRQHQVRRTVRHPDGAHADPRNAAIPGSSRKTSPAASEGSLSVSSSSQGFSKAMGGFVRLGLISAESCPLLNAAAPLSWVRRRSHTTHRDELKTRGERTGTETGSGSTSRSGTGSGMES